MRLLTHNMLTSHVKGVKNGYPLGIEVRPLYISLHGSLKNWTITKSHSLRSDLIFTWSRGFHLWDLLMLKIFSVAPDVSLKSYGIIIL